VLLSLLILFCFGLLSLVGSLTGATIGDPGLTGRVTLLVVGDGAFGSTVAGAALVGSEVALVGSNGLGVFCSVAGLAGYWKAIFDVSACLAGWVC